MKIRLLSDLHLEKWPFELTVCKQDLIVLAGDIADPMHDYRLEALFIDAVKQAPTIYIPGNHEYYGSTINKRNIRLRSLCRKFGVHFLIDEDYKLNGHTITGRVLWTDFNVKNRQSISMFLAEKGITDFYAIKGMTAKRMLDLYQEDYTKLRDSLINNKSTIVVTHFLPSPKSTHARFVDDRLSDYFCSSTLERLANEGLAPKVWLHGHTHDSLSYKHKCGTKVICNPRGYFNQDLNQSFNSQLIINV